MSAKLTPRDLKHAPARQPKRHARHIDGDLALVHEKHHLHLARVLAALVARGRQLDHARAEEIHRHHFGVAEGAAGYVVRDDAAGCEGDVCGSVLVSSCMD